MGPDPQPYRPLRTADGSLTLVHPVFGEAYSSSHGAWMQANELYLKQTQTHRHPSPRVLEVGFGLGMNFRATLESSLSRGVKLHYLSYEGFPLEREALALVDAPLSPPAQMVWEELLSSWQTLTGAALTLSGAWGHLYIRFEDVVQAGFPAGWASAVYLDPFSPEVNPEPWQPQVLRGLFGASQPGAFLATYSVAGQVRRSLADAGFVIRKVPGVGKRQWTQAWRP